MSVDLRNCKKGDILISNLGGILRYVGALSFETPFPHEVEYLYYDGKIGGLESGSRSNSGEVFLENKSPESDHDIVQIIPRNTWKKIKKL